MSFRVPATKFHTECEKLPVRSMVTEAKQVVCGAEFTVWLSSLSGISIL
jgi:hypothetical protein